jgi:hypothetical protein
VKVFFGTTEALRVEVWAEDLIYCQTPKLDPSRDVQTFLADSGTDTFTAVAHGMLDGEVVIVTNSGGALPAGLSAEDASGNVRPYYVVSATADTFQLSLTSGGPAVVITDDGTGTHSVDADGKVSLTVQNVEPEHGSVQAGNTEPYVLSDGETLDVIIDEGASQLVSFNTADFVTIGAATAAEVAAVINEDLVGASSHVLDGAPVIVTDTSGELGSVEIPSGTATALAFPTAASSGSDTVELIPGEELVVAKAFAPVRPDLSQESHLATVVGQLILELRRQVLENVTFTTHTDFDDDTGDLLNIATLSELPAILLVGLSTPENREHSPPEEEEDYELNDPTGPLGDFVTTRPAVIVDLVGTLVGVTDDDIQLFNMVQVVRIFFKKNPELDVPRQFGSPSSGTISYDLHSAINTQLSLTSLGNNSNVQFFAYDFKVEGIRLEDMPGLPMQGVSNLPDGFPAEAVVSVGKTADVIEVTVEKHDLPSS